MDEQSDTMPMIVRAGELARQIRKSDAYPALVGGIAGGIAGALMAAMIVGRAVPARAPTARLTNEAETSPRRAWTIREAIQLLTIVVSLIRQVQSWSKAKRGGES